MVARSTLFLAAALALAGAAFDSPSLYVPGIALGLLATASWLWVALAARGIRVHRAPGPRSIVEGDAYPVDVRVEAGRLPLPGGRVVHSQAERSPRIGRRATRVVLEVRSLRRGRRHVGPLAVRLGDPLGLHAAEVGDGRGEEVLVLPRVEPVVWGRESQAGTAGGGLDGSAPAALDTRLIDLELDGLRPYRAGSPASRIHWPAFARIGELVEHRLVDGSGSTPLVVLDSSAPAHEEALDRAVRAAASLCVHLARRGGCGLQLSGERRPLEVGRDLRTWAQVHARLAMVEPGGPVPANGRAPSGGLFWVTAAAPGQSGHPPVGGAPSYLVTPFRLDGGAGDFSVAGCDAYRLREARGRRAALAARARAAT